MEIAFLSDSITLGHSLTNFKGRFLTVLCKK